MRLSFYILFRVDPTVYSDVDENTPLEIALGDDEHRDLLFVLDEFMELPNEAKLVQLSLIVDSEPEEDWHRDRFSKILKSLPLDLVGYWSNDYPFLLRSTRTPLVFGLGPSFKKLCNRENFFWFKICWNKGEI